MPGYRDPPKHSQFKPGHSGNPKGGPKGPRGKFVRGDSTFLDEKISCTIGGKRFAGLRREAVVRIAALWSITKPVPGSSARGATEQEKLPKPNLGLQHLLLKLAEQEEEFDRRIRRDAPFFVIVSLLGSPDSVHCVEDAADVAGFGVKAYRKQKSARVLLENWVIEEGLARLGDRRLTRAEQELILAATRFPKTVTWPEWWEPDLCERRKGWRAPQVLQNMTPPKPPEMVRVGFREYWAAVERERLFLQEMDYSRDYHSWPPEDREGFYKPFEQPGGPALGGGVNPPLK